MSKQKFTSLLSKWKNQSRKRKAGSIVSIFVMSILIGNILFDREFLFEVQAYIERSDNSVDADSDVDSLANIGINDSSYLNAVSLDGTDQVIQENATNGGAGGGGSGASIMSNGFTELLSKRTQSYRHFYNPAFNKYRFQSDFAVYKENVVTGTNWVLQDEYPNRFIIRLTDGSIYFFETPAEITSFISGIANSTIWGVGIEGFDGVLAINLDFSNTYGHGQYLFYPRLKTGNLPAYNQPLYAIFDHLYVNISNTIYDEILHNKTLYAPAQNPRNHLHFENDSNELEIWFNIDDLTLLSTNWNFVHGLKLNLTDSLFNVITNFQCTSRGFDDVGLAYEVLVSPQAEGTSYQPEYFTIYNNTQSKTLNISQAWQAGTYLEDFYSHINIISANGNTFTFDFTDMEAAGFSEKYLNLHNQDIPARGTKKALRAGMYGYGSYSQNDWVYIDPIFSAKQSTDDNDFYITYNSATPSYTTNIGNDDVSVGFEKVGADAVMYRAFVTFDTGITDEISVIEDGVLTFYQESEAVEANEYIALGLYYNSSLTGGFWTESTADANDQTAFEQGKLWSEPSFYAPDGLSGNQTMDSTLTGYMLNNWTAIHNLDPANRRYLSFILENGTAQDWNSDDQTVFSESSIATTSQQMTLTFNYTLAPQDYALQWEHQCQNVPSTTMDSFNLTVFGSYDSFWCGWSDWSTELTTNGGFENGDITGWTEYTFNGDADWTAGTDPAFGDKGTQAGSYCAFIDENSNQGDYIRQDVDVSAYADYIDMGLAVINVSGWGVSAESSVDYYRIRAQALDSDLSVIGSDLVDSGYSLQTSWTKHGVYNYSIPINTRYIRVWGYTYENGWDSGSVDSFSVKIRYYKCEPDLNTEEEDFKFYKNIVINSDYVAGAGSFTDFPFLLDIYDTDLRGDVQPDGDDIRFADPENGWYYHEIELFDQSYNSTHAHLVAWIRLDSLSATSNSLIRMYYGNSTMSVQESPENVWISAYKGVWHLNNPSSLTNSTYYFDEYGATEWIDPQNSIDGQTGTRAHTNWTIANTNATHYLTGHNVMNTRDSIKKIYLRAYIDVYGTGKYYITPMFSGGNGTTRLFEDVYTDWTEWFEITNDPNTPSTWTWNDIDLIDIEVMATDPTSHDCSLNVLEIRIEHQDFYNDSTSYNNDGYALNSPLNDTTSKIDGGVSFDDTNERAVNISSDASLQLSTTIVVSAWILTTDSESDVGLVVNKWGSATSDRNYWLGKLNDQVFAFYVNDTENVRYALSNFNDGNWHYVVGVAEGTTLRLFLDGVQVNSTTYSGSSTVNGADLHIGKATETATQEFDGDIDEVRVSTHWVSADWINTTYQNQYDPASFYVLGSEHVVPERLVIQLWNISSSSWITTNFTINFDEQWYNFSIDQFSGVIGSSITWRYIDSKPISDTTQNELRIDYAGVFYWNYSIDLIETTWNLAKYDATLDDWQAIPENPFNISIESFYDFDIEIQGVDVTGTPVASDFVRVSNTSDVNNGFNLTTSYQTLVSDQSSSTTEVQFWMFVAYPKLSGGEYNTYQWTVKVKIKKA